MINYQFCKINNSKTIKLCNYLKLKVIQSQLPVLMIIKANESIIESENTVNTIDLDDEHNHNHTGYSP